MILKNLVSLHTFQNNAVNKCLKDLENIKRHTLPYQSSMMKWSEYKIENMIPSFAQDAFWRMDTMEKVQRFIMPSMTQGLVLRKAFEDLPVILGKEYLRLKDMSSFAAAGYIKELKTPFLSLRHLEANLITTHALAFEIYPKRLIGLLDAFKYKPIPEEYFIESEEVLQRINEIKKMHKHKSPATVRGFIQKTLHMCSNQMKLRVRECAPHRANDFDFVNTEFITAFYLALSDFNKASFSEIRKKETLREWFQSKINHHFRKNLLEDNFLNGSKLSKNCDPISGEHEHLLASPEAYEPIDKEAIWKAFYEKVGPKACNANVGRERVLELVLSGDFEKLSEIAKLAHEHGFKDVYPRYIRKFLHDYALTIWTPKPARL